MPHLSVISYTGSDSTSTVQSESVKQNKDKIRKSATTIRRTSKYAERKVRFRPSWQMLDKLPVPPTVSIPVQRCLEMQWKLPIMQLQMRIMATSEIRESRKQNIINDLPHRITGHSLPVVKNLCSIAEQNCHSLRSFSGINLTDMRPSGAPFVPQLVKVLITFIEKDCEPNSWQPVLAYHGKLRRQAEEHATKLISNYSNTGLLETLVNSLDVNMRVATLRAFLGMLSVKPLHLTKTQVKRITRWPLYDQYLRPNTMIKKFVLEVVIPQTRTTQDTLSYIMLHIIRVWKFSVPTQRSRLIEIYGPLLISFTERPIIVDRELSLDKTPESALLEAIMNVCDSQFWNHFLMSKVDELPSHEHVFPVQKHIRQRGLSTTIVPMPNEEHYGSTAGHTQVQRAKLRSTMAVYGEIRRVRRAYEYGQPVGADKRTEKSVSFVDGSKRLVQLTA
ncbi:hypothetical protein CSKR_203838 [Clonorchis sinensis]|uniref:Rho-GAP domain-containing protein n=1 Tax=Clonorchis sinensis TaxID=79923 RepID=A0A8T1N2Y1_CLOSI|nr:hypothetical protein CSKR_203838 [Clonorchis sinensis]